MNLLSLTALWRLGVSALYFLGWQSIENFVPQSVFEIEVNRQPFVNNKKLVDAHSIRSIS